MFASIGAVNYPARTNGNNTFYGTNSHIGPLIVGGEFTFSGVAKTLSSVGIKIGLDTGKYNASSRTVSIGNSAGRDSTNGQNSVFIGNDAGIRANDADSSVFIGYSAGSLATNADECVFIGSLAGSDITNSRVLIIHASQSNVGTNGLIYGQFDNRLLRVNGRLEATNGFLLRSNLVSQIPTLSPGDNFYWSSNGVPHVIWQDQAGTQATNRLVP
jgi:hypothetical protein